jgi:hypothetical protein
MRLLLILIVFGSFTLLAGEWMNATFSLWSRSILVDFTQAEIDAPDVYRLQLTIPLDQTWIFSSQIRLYDAYGDKFSYTPRMKSLNASGQGLFTIQNKRSLLVAWPTSSMALPAKGKGVLVFPALLSLRMINAAFFLLFASSIALFRSLPFPTWKSKVLAQRFMALTAWCLRLFGRHPSIALSLPSAYLLSVYPPLWKDVDALCQLILPADATNIYHFPALFCFSARLIFWLGDCFTVWRPPHLLALQTPTLQGIYALVVVQHSALVLSLSILCKTLTKREGLRGVFVLGFCFASSLYTNVLLCGSEAWSICATISLFAFGLRLYLREGSETINWIGYLFSLVFAIGSRHINLLLGFWFIGLCLVTSILRLRYGLRSGLPSRPLLKAALALILLVVAAYSNGFFQLCLASWVGIEPRTTLGRTLSDRIDSFLTQMRPDERARLAQQLAAITSDGNVRLAIQDQATIGSFYKGTNVILEQQLRAAGLTGEHLQAEKDRVILKAALVYLKSLHPLFVRTIWQDFLKGFTETSNGSFALEPFVENSNVGIYRLYRPDQWIPFNVLSSTFLPESAAWLDRSGSDLYLKGVTIKGFKRSHLSSMLLLTLLFLGSCFWYHRGVCSRAVLAVTILLTGMAVFAATMICAYFLPRYALPLWVSVLIALSLAIEALFAARF